ncbi:hypothetical protein JZ751_014611 [Albula glossodonta]|uniref:Uncharacterized protein n=1 Tax=Albula glossodonta TaxID=121402 RepID=A0A8T2MXS2_9TELE|nr:hypothetical protein JZ751_014611 [Albula glossodonta]
MFQRDLRVHLPRSGASGLLTEKTVGVEEDHRGTSPGDMYFPWEDGEAALCRPPSTGLQELAKGKYYNSPAELAKDVPGGREWGGGRGGTLGELVCALASERRTAAEQRFTSTIYAAESEEKREEAVVTFCR